MQITSKIKILFEKQIASTFKKNKNYKLGNYMLTMPMQMTLPNNQKKHRLYDQFLPTLAHYLPSKGLIIDVGANVGDTTLAMMQYCNNSFLCVEASDFFRQYLQNNINALPEKERERITIIQKLAGTKTLVGEIQLNKKTTACLNINMDKNKTPSTHMPVDDMVYDPKDIILLKSDTDGYDYDVLLSAEKIMSESEPILFWENEIQEDFQLEGYEKLYKLLEEKGYKHLYVFDNFGNLIFNEASFSTLTQLNYYIHSMKKYNTTRTFFYTDVLAVTEKHKMLVDEVILIYKEHKIQNTKK